LNYEVVITDKAIESFETICNHILTISGENGKQKFSEIVSDYIDLFEKIPSTFGFYSKDLNIRKAHIHKFCTVFFIIDQSNLSVSILLFFDN
jgi:hypothetical protein